MRIAIPSIDDKGLDSFVGEHFGRSPFYTIVDIEKSEIKNVKAIKTPFGSHSPGDIPNFLFSQKVNVIIARGIGWRAKDWFKKLGIQVITGASGKIRDIVQSFIKGELVSTPYEPKERFHEHG